MKGTIDDLRHTARDLTKRPGFAIAALLTLTIGVGANSAIFSFVDALLLRPLPLGAHGERVVSLHSTHPSQPRDWEDSPVSWVDLQDLRGTDSLEDAGGYVGRSFTLLADGAAERVRGGSITPNLFVVLGLQPALGRNFTEEEGQDFGFEPSVILSHRLWQRRFGGDPDILQRPVGINGRALTVVGVMPEGIRFPERDELWVPYRPSEPHRGQNRISAFGVLRPNADLAQARRELDLVATRLAAEYPDSNRGWGFAVLPFRDLVVDPGTRAIMAALMGAVAFVLLIGCANLTNLLLARGVARQQELAVRAALGASRGRLVRQLLVESALLAGMGTLLGAAVGSWSVDLIVASWPEELPYWLRFDLDTRVVAFHASIGLLTALAVGLLPALRATQGDVASRLKEGTRGTQGAAHQRLQGALVVGQVSLCLALLVGANLMIRSFLRLQAAPSGFDEEGLLTMRLYVSGDAYDPAEARAALVSRATHRIEALPGVSGASFTSSIPTDDGGAPLRVVADGQPVPPGEEPGALQIVATPELFATLRVPLRQGRGFDAAEHSDPDSDAVIVNDRLARSFWSGESAIDRRIGLVGPEGTSWRRIVGVVPDIHYEEFGEETAQSTLNVFVPYARSPYRGLALIVRATSEPRTLAEPVQRALRVVEPTLAIFDVRTMEDVRVYTTWEQRFFGHLMGTFAIQALLLACLGIYGVLSYAISQRRHEIGIRLALGARRPDVVALIVRRGVGLALLGSAIGFLLALGLGGVLRSILYDIGPFDPLALGGMAALMLAVAAAASLLPARRAAGVDPMAALRVD